MNLHPSNANSSPENFKSQGMVANMESSNNFSNSSIYANRKRKNFIGAFHVSYGDWVDFFAVDFEHPVL